MMCFLVDMSVLWLLSLALCNASVRTTKRLLLLQEAANPAQRHLHRRANDHSLALPCRHAKQHLRRSSRGHRQDSQVSIMWICQHLLFSKHHRHSDAASEMWRSMAVPDRAGTGKIDLSVMSGHLLAGVHRHCKATIGTIAVETCCPPAAQSGCKFLQQHNHGMLSSICALLKLNPAQLKLATSKCDTVADLCLQNSE